MWLTEFPHFSIRDCGTTFVLSGELLWQKVLMAVKCINRYHRRINDEIRDKARILLLQVKMFTATVIVCTRLI